MTSSVINNVLHQKIDNILYEPSLSLLDNIIYELSYYFFVFSSNEPNQQYRANVPNVISLFGYNQDIYDYRFMLSNDLERNAQHGTLAQAYHINTALIINAVKNYKKEDRHIISQNLRNTYKIFLNNAAYEALGQPNKSFLIPVGVPNLFNIVDPKANRKPVAILDRVGVGGQIQQLFAKDNIDCDIINPMSGLNIKGLNYVFNKYSTIIDLSDYCNINLLCALASGCRAITLQSNYTDCPLIEKYNDIETIVSETIKNKSLDIEKTKDYIHNYHNFDRFIDAINNIFQNIDKEAYIQ